MSPTAGSDDLDRFADAIRLLRSLPYPDEPIEVGFKGKGAEFNWRGLDGYIVHGVLEPNGEVLGLVELSVRALDPAQDVSSDVLRAVRLGDILPIVRARLTWAATNEDKGRRLGGMRRRPTQHRATASKAAKQKRRGGRPALGDDHHGRIALALLDEMSQGKARGVNQRLKARLDKEFGRDIPEQTIRTWVRAAQDAGWLAKAQQGKPGREPGWKLVDEMRRSRS